MRAREIREFSHMAKGKRVFLVITPEVRNDGVLVNELRVAELLTNNQEQGFLPGAVLVKEIKDFE